MGTNKTGSKVSEKLCNKKASDMISLPRWFPPFICIFFFHSSTPNESFLFNHFSPELPIFCTAYSRCRAASGVLQETRSFTLEIHLSSTLFEYFFSQRAFPSRSLSMIRSVIQADCIKAISAKWNTCLVSAAHSLFIRLLTSETNLEKKEKQSCLWSYGLEEHSLMSSRGCAASWFTLNVINLSLPRRPPSPRSEGER